MNQVEIVYSTSKHWNVNSRISLKSDNVLVIRRLLGFNFAYMRVSAGILGVSKANFVNESISHDYPLKLPLNVTFNLF